MFGCEPIVAEQSINNNKMTVFNEFGSSIQTILTSFGDRLISVFASDARDENNVNLSLLIVEQLTKIGNDFLAAIEKIVINVVLASWLNLKPIDELMREMEAKFTEELSKLIQELNDLLAYLMENYLETASYRQTFIDEFEAGALSLLESVLKHLKEVYRVVEYMIMDRNNILEWMFAMFGLGAVAHLFYTFPMNLLTAFVHIATQLLFATAAVIAQAQVIFDNMMNQMLQDIANAVEYAWNAVHSLTILLAGK
jgi:hypothetical protein